MFDNVIFIGGIHGVGKSTICKQTDFTSESIRILSNFREYCPT